MSDERSAERVHRREKKDNDSRTKEASGTKLESPSTGERFRKREASSEPKPAAAVGPKLPPPIHPTTTASTAKRARITFDLGSPPTTTRKITLKRSSNEVAARGN